MKGKKGYLKRHKSAFENFKEKQTQQKAPKAKRTKPAKLKVYKEKTRVCLQCGAAVIRHYVFCCADHAKLWGSLNPNNGRAF